MIRRSATLLVLPAWIAGLSAARADEWFARDKALHFGATATIASGGYGLTMLLTERGLEDRRAWAFGVGLGLAMGAGIAKEAWDATGRGDPSWKDLAWDGVGTGAGLLLAFGLDRLLTSDEAAPRRSGSNGRPLARTFDLRPSTFGRYGVGARATFEF